MCDDMIGVIPPQRKEGRIPVGRVGLWVCLLLAASQTGIAGDSPSPLGRGDTNPALTRFGKAIVFYLSFDRHELAEITAGAPEPQRDRWVNSPTGEAIAMDELLILNVPLTRGEIAWLYQVHVTRDSDRKAQEHATRDTRRLPVWPGPDTMQ